MIRTLIHWAVQLQAHIHHTHTHQANSRHILQAHAYMVQVRDALREVVLRSIRLCLLLSWLRSTPLSRHPVMSLFSLVISSFTPSAKVSSSECLSQLNNL
jgi:fumarate hydratase class II